MAESFSTNHRFFDNKHYPRGFSRHGDFTIKEAQVLERFGYAFNELDLGTREPQTEEEQLFVAVCRGDVSLRQKQRRFGRSILHAFVVLSVSTPCPAVNRRWIRWKNTLTVMTKNSGPLAPFFIAVPDGDVGLNDPLSDS